MVKAAHGAVDPEVLLGLAMAAEDDLDARPSHHDDGDEHDHDDFVSFSVEMAEIDSPEALITRLHNAVERHAILRVKGFAAVAGKEMRLVTQGVGARIQHYYDRPWGPEETRASRLVVIGRQGLDEVAVREALGA